jgi:hypothetical protein
LIAEKILDDLYVNWTTDPEQIVTETRKKRGGVEVLAEGDAVAG